jgi:hypothetical protein
VTTVQKATAYRNEFLGLRALGIIRSTRDLSSSNNKKKNSVMDQRGVTAQQVTTEGRTEVQCSAQTTPQQSLGGDTKSNRMTVSQQHARAQKSSSGCAPWGPSCKPNECSVAHCLCEPVRGVGVLERFEAVTLVAAPHRLAAAAARSARADGRIGTALDHTKVRKRPRMHPVPRRLCKPSACETHTKKSMWRDCE